MAQKGKFKVGLNNFISWGATVVIIGLMAKLMHWPWGDWLIVVGLGTEALLFFLLGFQRDEETVTAPVTVNNAGVTVALDNMLHDANISQEMIGRLGDGLRTFGEKVHAISNVSDVSLASSQFAASLKTASEGFGKLNHSFEKVTQDLANIGNTGTDTTSYQEQINKLASNLKNLNAVYEQELLESGNKLRTITQEFDKIGESFKNFNASATDSQELKEQVQTLNKNLAALNAVYGNMLVAMNQKSN